jgi:hypothetical protein
MVFSMHKFFMKSKPPVVPQPPFATDPSPTEFLLFPKGEVNLKGHKISISRRNTRKKWLEMQASMLSDNCRTLCQEDNV